MSELICGKCKREFKSQIALDSHTHAMHPGGISNIVSKETKSKVGITLLVGILLVVVVAIGFSMADVKTLPPTSMIGHIEQNPVSHVSRTPFPINVQKHMLEHSDGKEIPGVILNYNCEQYECEPGLIEKLESFAAKYPEYVYVAPFSNMEAKIALSKLGKLNVLDEYNETVIDQFIRSR